MKSENLVSINVRRVKHKKNKNTIKKRKYLKILTCKTPEIKEQQNEIIFKYLLKAFTRNKDPVVFLFSRLKWANLSIINNIFKFAATIH